MKLTWYIQPLSHHENTAQCIAYLAEERGVNVISNDYIPFGGSNWEEILPNYKEGPVTILASINALKSCQNAKIQNYDLVDWCDWKQLCCSTYYNYWGEWLLSQTYGFYPLKETIRLAEKGTLFDLFGNENFIFIKPDTNDKIFDGEVLCSNHIDRWKYQVTIEHPNDTLLCLVAKPSQIEAEYRLVISDKKVISSSRYKLDGRFSMDRGCPDECVEIAEKACGMWEPHSFFVLDMAKSCGRFYVLECGSVNLAGFYECDLVPITDAFIEHMKRDSMISSY